MIAKTLSALPYGFESSLIEVEGDKNQGLPAFNIVGMAKKTISEARERVKSALRASGFSFPTEKITLNLAPADLEKEGTSLDLPIAINLLILSGQLRQEDVENAAFAGELSLDGGLKPIRGAVNIAEAAKKAGLKFLFIPVANLDQARLISGIKIVGIDSLPQLFLHLKGEKTIQNPKSVVKNTETDVETLKFTDIKGQPLAKRALEIALAGHHNILLSGPPGTGKTALSKAALSLLPDLTRQELISVTKLYSLTEATGHISKKRPFRAPHHTSSLISLIGGGASAKPGEISLAHLGVLFLDELPEFKRDHLEALRQPLEDKTISISRANHKYTYPADFTLIATMNPCPCGYLGDLAHPCSCTEFQIKNYQRRISGPLLDRIDLFVEVSRVKTSELITAVNPVNSPDQSLDVVKNTIKGAISSQHSRYHNDTLYNASLSSAMIVKHIPLAPQVKRFLDQAATALDLSARSYFKIIKVARTIADLDRAQEVSEDHIKEALSFRRKTP